MKRFITLLITLMIWGTCLISAQTTAADNGRKEASRRFYIEIVGMHTPGRPQAMRVSVNLGKMLNTRTGLTAEQLAQATRDLQFSSMIDAMNTLSLYGWTLVDTYSETMAGTVTTHWIAAKEVVDPLELLTGLIKN